HATARPPAPSPRPLTGPPPPPGAIRNDHIPAAPALSTPATDADKAEGNSGATPFTFTVSRTGDLSGASSVDWAVSGPPADAADFVGGVLPSGTLNFAVGEASKTITVNVAGDTAVAGAEGFSVTLSHRLGANTSVSSRGATA